MGILTVAAAQVSESPPFFRSSRTAFDFVLMDLMTSLQGGMVDALVTSPLVAASSQWFGIAGNMTAMKLAPLWGAAVVSMKSWSQIPADLQPRLLDAAEKITESLAPDLAKADGQAIDVMRKYGLKIHQVPPPVLTSWQDL